MTVAPRGSWVVETLRREGRWCTFIAGSLGRLRRPGEAPPAWASLRGSRWDRWFQGRLFSPQPPHSQHHGGLASSGRVPPLRGGCPPHVRRYFLALSGLGPVWAQGLHGGHAKVAGARRAPGRIWWSQDRAPGRGGPRDPAGKPAGTCQRHVLGGGPDVGPETQACAGHVSTGHPPQPPQTRGLWLWVWTG